MSDAYERPPLPHNVEQDYSYAGVERFRESEVERHKSRSRSSKKVAVGLSALLAEFVLLAVGTFGRGGLDDPLVLIIIVSLVIACASSAWLLIQGFQELLQSRPIPLPQGHRATTQSSRPENGSVEKSAERQLLEVIEANGEITPARAALQTSLTVEEAERLLSDLAKRGHLDVRVEGSKLVYSL